MASLLVTFWILPGLVTALTPLTYREVVGLTKDALITAFATGNLFVVLPILTEKSQELLRNHETYRSRTPVNLTVDPGLMSLQNEGTMARKSATKHSKASTKKSVEQGWWWVP